MRRRLWLMTLIALGGAALGCGGYMSPTEKLDLAVLRYHDALRWRQYEVASTFIPDDKKKAYLETRRALDEDFRIHDVDVKEVRQVEAAKIAEVIIEVAYTETSSNVLERVKLMETWTYGEDRNWFLTKQEESKEKVKPKSKPGGGAVWEKF